MENRYDLERLMEEDREFFEDTGQYDYDLQAEVDPNISRKIIAHFERERLASNSVPKPVKDPLVAKAMSIRRDYQTATERREHISLGELRKRASELRKLGARLPQNYRGMSSPQLYRFVEKLVSDILD